MLVIDREQKLKIKQEKHDRDVNERCKRIHNAKWLHNGIDKAALDKQIQERKEKEEKERKANETYEKYRIDALAKAKELEEEEKKAKRQLEKETVEYWKTHQAANTRVSYDLDDPSRLKNETLPDRDDHIKVGASSLLRMGGDDLNGCIRRRMQKEQNRTWFEQQISNKKKLQEQNKYSEENYLKVIFSEQEIIHDKIQKEKEQKLEIQREILEFNRKMAEEKAKQLREEKCRLAEGDNFIMQSSLGPVLTEDQHMPRCSTGGNRIVTSMYKGMTEEKKIEFKKGLEEQIEEIAKRKELERKSQTEWDKHYVKMYREGLLRAREEERTKKQIELQTIEENKKVADEQKAMQKEREKEFRENQISKEFYDQFERCA